MNSQLGYELGLPQTSSNDEELEQLLNLLESAQEQALRPSNVFHSEAESEYARGCPTSVRETVSGFPRYQNSVASLPRGEQEKIKKLARLIVSTFQRGCPSIVIVRLTGHADLDPQREPGFMLKISRERALAVKRGLEMLISSAAISSRVAWQVRGVGASQLVVSTPRTEQERRRNRRVEIQLGTVNPVSPDYIRWMQTCLNQVLGTRIAVTGVILPETRGAIRRFQQRQGLALTGTVTPQTIGSLISVCGNLPIVPPSPTAQIQIVSPADNTQFAITDAPRMPAINAEARIVGITPDPTPSAAFEWTAQIRFDARTCVFGPNRQINPPDIVQTVVGGRFTPNFTSIRGGELTLIVRASIGGQILEARTTGLRIAGTNPQRVDVQQALPHATLRRIACQESSSTRRHRAHPFAGQRQFDAPPNGGVSDCPLFSSDGAGGVGIMQITNPLPTDDDVWNWRQNVATGIQIFNQKVQGARNYPRQVRGSAGFRALVDNFNRARQAQGLPPVQVMLPDFTTGNFDNNLQQLELDAIRGFNGWGGRDQFRFPLHEFRVAVDGNGLLQVVNIQPATVGGRKVVVGQAVWERVPVAARPQNFGDPDYVNHVLGRNPQCP
jgi:outer membrane protein OmpA-like peptidoglycan-associated protein/peptidoglycan hydrolase-like protein with peptidoglycan-binding domain